MENKKPIPKQALTQPSWLSLLGVLVFSWLDMLTLAFVFSNKADPRSTLGEILFPVAIVCACFAGIAVAKICWSRGRGFTTALTVMLIVDIALALILIGYGQIPGKVQACYATCQNVDSQLIIFASLAAPTILTLAGSIAAYRYYGWVKKYNLPRPVIKAPMSQNL